MPSMPLYFWNDPDGSRYRESYFATYPGVWRHGDLVEFGPDGSSVIIGRSDATLNRNGIRLGPADIYQVVEGLPEVRDSLVVGVEQGDGYYMPLFVHFAGGVEPGGRGGQGTASDPLRAVAPLRARRHHPGLRRAPHADRQEARGPGQAAHPGSSRWNWSLILAR